MNTYFIFVIQTTSWTKLRSIYEIICRKLTNRHETGCVQLHTSGQVVHILKIKSIAEVFFLHKLNSFMSCVEILCILSGKDKEYSKYENNSDRSSKII